VPAILHVTGVPDVAANRPASTSAACSWASAGPRAAGAEHRDRRAGGVERGLEQLDFGVNVTSFTVPALGQALLTVSYNPSSPGPDAER